MNSGPANGEAGTSGDLKTERGATVSVGWKAMIKFQCCHPPVLRKGQLGAVSIISKTFG